MGLVIESKPVPLRTDEGGAVRVGGTRVTLDTVVTAFQQGATPEEIGQQYPSLRLADIYAVIWYYLQHRPEVEGYLRERGKEAERIRREMESRFTPTGVRERLMARQARQTSDQ
jgi:uncharacterized protein (DUF433 family)